MKEIKILKEIRDELSDPYENCHLVQVEKLNGVIESLESQVIENRKSGGWEIGLIGIVFLAWSIYMVFSGGFKI